MCFHVTSRAVVSSCGAKEDTESSLRIHEKEYSGSVPFIKGDLVLQLDDSDSLFVQIYNRGLGENPNNRANNKKKKHIRTLRLVYM